MNGVRVNNLHPESHIAAYSKWSAFGLARLVAVLIILVLGFAAQPALAQDMPIVISPLKVEPDGNGVNIADGKTTVSDNGSALPSLAISSVGRVEGLQLLFTMTRSGPTPGTSNLTATVGGEYTTKTETVSFAAGQTPTTIAVNILVDAVKPETAETLRVTISAPSAGASIPNAGSKRTGAINAN